jgi:hypothetical protein
MQYIRAHCNLCYNCSCSTNEVTSCIIDDLKNIIESNYIIYIKYNCDCNCFNSFINEYGNTINYFFGTNIVRIINENYFKDPGSYRIEFNVVHNTHIITKYLPSPIGYIIINETEFFNSITSGTHIQFINSNQDLLDTFRNKLKDKSFTLEERVLRIDPGLKVCCYFINKETLIKPAVKK